jgi:two-component system, NtrC family, response regulator AtoC
MESLKIFVVEDEPWYADYLKYILSLNPDYEIECFTNGKDCLRNLYKKPDVITLDYILPDTSGKELLKNILAQNPEIVVIIISSQENITTAVELLKDGARDYIVKNEETRERIWNSMRIIRENLSLKQENEKLKEIVGKKYEFSVNIHGNSPAIREVFKLIEKAASSQFTVSITGETGTGKELVAKAIHYQSDRKNYPFIAVNVGAIPGELIESELFGYEKGSFTGAINRKTGVFENANKGTLFLDEIAEMDLNMQTKLLRALQEREITRIGGNENIKIDVRVITATNKNLSDEVKKGAFRTDLYYRVMGLPIRVAPLRERGNDVIILAKHFADLFCKENRRKKVTFSEEATIKLLNYTYPGNVRELKAVIELAIILSETDVILPDHINFNPARGLEEIFIEETTLEAYIRKIIFNFMDRYRSNPTIVAKKLGISRPTIYRYMKSSTGLSD